MSKLFKSLKKGLEEAIAFSEGKITLKSEFIEIPEPPKEYSSKEIRGIREKNSYSQSIFARILNVSPRTVQSWESGVRVPSHSALRLLEIIDKGFYGTSYKTKYYQNSSQSMSRTHQFNYEKRKS